MSKLNKEQIKEVYKEYLTKNTNCQRLGNKYNVSKSTINYWLRKNNIAINNDKITLRREYHINDKYFDNIDSAKKAYFLGFLFADGYNNGKNRVTISLQEDDKEILEKFKKEIDSNKPLYFRNRKRKNNRLKNQYVLDIVSQNICKKLTRLGCIRAKTFKLDFPKNIKKKFLRDFIRGYCDGDGSFGRYKINNKYYQTSLCIVSTNKFCKKLKHIFENKLGVNSYICKRHKDRKTTTRQIKVSGINQVMKILDFLYKNNDIALLRKYQRYQDIKNATNKKYYS